MSKPDDIPQSVWDSADKVRFSLPADWDGSREDHVLPIARAIMAATLAEREACAAHLEQAAKDSSLGHESTTRGASTYNWLTYCASLLRKRGEA